MKNTYVTFGQTHVHSVNGKTFDKDCVAVIKANSKSEGRDLAFEYFGDKFCFEYHDTEFDNRSLNYFPRGLMNVN